MLEWLKTIWNLPARLKSLDTRIDRWNQNLIDAEARERKEARAASDFNLKQIEAMRRFLQLTTDCHVDVAMHRDVPHTVILIGSYNGQDYVRVAAINTEGFQHLVRMLKDMERYCEVRTIDAPRDVRFMLREEMNRV
jgi:hypothetical protein